MANSEWLNIEVLEAYLEGKLDAQTMHRVEKLSLEDPFVAQALEGLLDTKNSSQTISILQKQLQERVARKPIERKIWHITSQRLSIAATAAVLFITVGILFWMKEEQRRKQAELAASQAKNIEIDIKPFADTIAQTDIPAHLPPSAPLINSEQTVGKVLPIEHQDIAKNDTSKKTVVETTLLQPPGKEIVNANIKKEINAPPEVAMVTPLPITASVPPVQALQSKVDGVQVKLDPTTVRGVVLDSRGVPISGVSVKVTGEDMGVTTNISGEFMLAVDKVKEIPLEIESVGYGRKNIMAQADEKVRIRLENNNAVISGGLAADSNKDKKTAIAKEEPLTIEKSSYSMAHPIGGWEAYQNYLKQNNKLFTTGKHIVELSFIVSVNGAPTDIKIVKAQTQAMNDEAIRLLKTGPKWSYVAETVNTGSVTIKF